MVTDILHTGHLLKTEGDAFAPKNPGVLSWIRCVFSKHGLPKGSSLALEAIIEMPEYFFLEGWCRHQAPCFNAVAHILWDSVYYRPLNALHALVGDNLCDLVPSSDYVGGAPYFNAIRLFETPVAYCNRVIKPVDLFPCLGHSQRAILFKV